MSAVVLDAHEKVACLGPAVQHGSAGAPAVQQSRIPEDLEVTADGPESLAGERHQLATASSSASVRWRLRVRNVPIRSPTRGK